MPIINGGGFLGWSSDGSGSGGGGTIDIIDHLTSTATDKALSANMGRELDKLIGTHSTLVASDTVLGHVKVDGSTITIDSDGTISAVGGSGGDTEIIDDLNSTRTDAALSANKGRELKELQDNHKDLIASQTVLGHIKIDGATIKVTADGTAYTDILSNGIVQTSWQGVIPTTAVGQNEWIIPLGTLDKDNDTIFIVNNTTLLQNDMYTIIEIDGNYVVRVNDIPSDLPISKNNMYVVVLQNTASNGMNAISGSLIIDDTIDEPKLHPDLREKINTRVIISGVKGIVENRMQDDILHVPFDFEVVKITATMLTPSSNTCYVNFKKTTDFVAWTDLFANIEILPNTYHTDIPITSQVIVREGEFIRLFTDSFVGAQSLTVNVVIKTI